MDTDQSTSKNAAFSLFSGDSGKLAENPFPSLAQLRAMGAVVPIPFPFMGNRRAWAVTRMEEAVQVLKDHIHFTVDASSLGGRGIARHHDAEAASAPTFFTARSMLTVDDPDHRRLRMLVSKAFTPKYIEGLRPHVQEIADELLDRVQDQGQMDLVEVYAYPLPINVISDMLGVPRNDRDQLRTWSQALARGMSLGMRDMGVVDHMRAFGAYTAQLVADKRQHPADDLISRLAAIEEEGDRLSETELIAMITLLIFAGHETTSNLLATGTLMLLDRPDQLEKLKADLSLVPAVVEELLRFNGPASTTGPRFATEDIELAGQQIKKGDVLFPVVMSANHDETQFTNPDELDIARNLERHLAFGHGIHMCLGAPLARLEGDIAFTTLLKRMPNLRLAVPRKSITWHANLNTWSVVSLPVAF